MEEEGLYKKGLALRAQGHYREAGECFRRAADAGDPDACWEMFHISMFGGCCMAPGSLSEGTRALSRGLTQGSELCKVKFYKDNGGKDEETLFSELTQKDSILYFGICHPHFLPRCLAGLNPESFQKNSWFKFLYARAMISSDRQIAKEYLTLAARLGLAVAQKTLFHEFQDRSFLKDAANQHDTGAICMLLDEPDLCQFSNSQEIAHIFFVASEIFVNRPLDSLFCKHPIADSKEIRYWIGGYIYQKEVVINRLDPDDPAQFEPEEYRCLSIYRCARQRARAAALALLSVVAGRRRLDLRRWMALDIWRLVARMVAAEEIKFL